MKMRHARTTMFAACLMAAGMSAAEDTREPVTMPPMMQAHMLANMREHLETLDGLLAALVDEDLEAAAELAESRLGISSLARHGADHMAPLMPPGMREAGTAMHRAASRFALVAQEGDRERAYGALREVTASCVACHSSYRLR